MEEEVIAYVLESSKGNMEEAAAGLWFMKIMKAFMVAGATTVPLPEVGCCCCWWWCYLHFMEHGCVAVFSNTDAFVLFFFSFFFSPLR